MQEFGKIFQIQHKNCEKGFDLKKIGGKCNQWLLLNRLFGPREGEFQIKLRKTLNLAKTVFDVGKTDVI